ncbi:MAG: hypothetical protein GY760_16410 [Deltaproteobacteria bacterium]|nr:hypothetical protein [Deltaproteobacteria bacterium]
MKNRSRTLKIYPTLCESVKLSVRKIAELTGISKSAAHRHKKTILKRNDFPESYLWESEEGLIFLKRLYYGSIILLCVQCGIGAKKLTEFFMFLRLDQHIGVKPSTIKKNANEICEMLGKYKEEQEQTQLDKPLKIVGGIDETFFNEMILVLMDLSSGYLFVEEESDSKTYDTWYEKAKKVADRFKIKFEYFVSDRAKQLIKLAVQGFKCSSIPDLFHASNELVKQFGMSMNKKKANIQKKVAEAVAQLALLKELSQDISAQEIIVNELQKQQEVINKGCSNYHEVLHRLSKTVHPFNIESLSPVTSAMVRIILYTILKDAEALKEEFNISSKKNHLKKFKNQIEELASLIDIWWLWVDKRLQSDDISNDLRTWIKKYLLPLLYWEQQAGKTKNTNLKEAYQSAADKARLAFDEHPLTQEFIQNEEIISWADWMVCNFQRTSSAVEGRNGWLTQMHHNGRGFTPKRLKAQTVFHNYYLKRPDGTTAAERLFRTKFPDPIEWVVERMGDLPLPRCMDVTY